MIRSPCGWTVSLYAKNSLDALCSHLACCLDLTMLVTIHIASTGTGLFRSSVRCGSCRSWREGDSWRVRQDFSLGLRTASDLRFAMTPQFLSSIRTCATVRTSTVLFAARKTPWSSIPPLALNASAPTAKCAAVLSRSSWNAKKGSWWRSMPWVIPSLSKACGVIEHPQQNVQADE